jgi:hypothetical protein
VMMRSTTEKFALVTSSKRQSIADISFIKTWKSTFFHLSTYRSTHCMKLQLCSLQLDDPFINHPSLW